MTFGIKKKKKNMASLLMCGACVVWVDGFWSGCELSTGTGLQDDNVRAVHRATYTR